MAEAIMGWLEGLPAKLPEVKPKKLKLLIISDLTKHIDEITKAYEEVVGKDDQYSARIYYEYFALDMNGLRTDEMTGYYAGWSDYGIFEQELKDLFDEPKWVIIYPIKKDEPILIGFGTKVGYEFDIIDFRPNEKRLELYKEYVKGANKGVKFMVNSIAGVKLEHLYDELEVASKEIDASRKRAMLYEEDEIPLEVVRKLGIVRGMERILTKIMRGNVVEVSKWIRYMSDKIDLEEVEAISLE